MAQLLSAIIPASFPTLALAHFLALISPGPDFFLIVGHAARRKLRGALPLCAGIACGNALYIILAIAGWTVIRHSPLIYRGLELAGGGYLLWMGALLLRASRRSAVLSATEARVISPVKQFGAGLASALLNPKNAIFYLTLMTVIIGQEASLGQRTFAGIWMTSVVFCWDVGLAALIGLPATQHVLQRFIPRIEAAAGCFLVLTGAGLLLSPWFNAA